MWVFFLFLFCVSPVPVESYYQEAFFQCFAITKTNIIWKFNNDVIFSMTSSEPFLNDSWRPFIDAVTQSYDLILKDLTPEQEGFYFCHNRRQYTNRLKGEIVDDTLSVTAFQLKINMRQKLQKLSGNHISEHLLMRHWKFCLSAHECTSCQAESCSTIDYRWYVKTGLKLD